MPRTRSLLSCLLVLPVLAACDPEPTRMGWRLDPDALLAQAQATPSKGVSYEGSWDIDGAATRGKLLEAGVPEEFADRAMSAMQFSLELRPGGSATVRGTSMQGPFEEQTTWQDSGGALSLQVRGQTATGTLTETGKLELSMPMGPRTMTIVFAPEAADAANALELALEGEARPGLSGRLNLLPDGTFGLTVTQPNTRPFVAEGTYTRGSGTLTLRDASGRSFTGRQTGDRVEIGVEVDGRQITLVYRQIAEASSGAGAES